MYRGTWNHTDIAAKQYVPHLPSTTDSQEDSMQGQAARAVAAAQVRPQAWPWPRLARRAFLHTQLPDILIGLVIGPAASRVWDAPCDKAAHADLADTLMHKQLHPTTVAIPVTMDDKSVHAGSAMQHAPCWYYQNFGTTKSSTYIVCAALCLPGCFCQAGVPTDEAEPSKPGQVRQQLVLPANYSVLMA